MLTLDGYLKNIGQIYSSWERGIISSDECLTRIEYQLEEFNRLEIED